MFKKPVLSDPSNFQCIILVALNLGKCKYVQIYIMHQLSRAISMLLTYTQRAWETVERINFLELPQRQRSKS